MQVSYQGFPVWFISLLSMVLLHFYYVKCQTWFVQLPLFIMESGARSMWCGSVRYCMWVLRPSTSMNLSLYVPGVLAKRQRQTSRVAGWAANLLWSFGAEHPVWEKERLKRPRVHVGNVAYVFPSNEASVISQIMCNVRMSLKVNCLCS